MPRAPERNCMLWRLWLTISTNFHFHFRRIEHPSTDPKFRGKSEIFSLTFQGEKTAADSDIEPAATCTQIQSKTIHHLAR